MSRSKCSGCFLRQQQQRQPSDDFDLQREDSRSENVRFMKIRLRPPPPPPPSCCFFGWLFKKNQRQASLQNHHNNREPLLWELSEAELNGTRSASLFSRFKNWCK
eukprot:TRINITY_DN3629_c0_g1_i1.p1 TRINITY_DN3629_c0_g1~~TRINITY_DN3629_c0_g1_i1.p1  ORF type:complete len:105 (+),score=15.99 TRINITY_DN3629_c0_g1_i1:93-407(+)